MKVRDDLAAAAWRAARGGDAPEAPWRALAAAYPSGDALDDALAATLRRAAATAVLSLPTRLDPVAGQQAVLAAKADARGLLDRPEPAVVAVSTWLGRLFPGVGPALASATLEAFAVQARDLVGLAQGEGTSGRAPGDAALERIYAFAGEAESSGRRGPAIAALGLVAAAARERADAALEAQALQRAGRLLCEAPPGEAEPGPGLVLLLFAADLGATVDPVFADLVRRYVTGFQYTLSDAEFAAIEPLLDRERDEVVAETFARYRAHFPGEPS